MSNHARILTSVRSHPAILKVGPAAAWLWLCSVLHCKDMRSEFVYDIQLPCLGVDHPGRYVDALVTQGLWTPARKGGHDGWWVTTRLPKPTRNRPGLRYMFDRLVTWWGRKCVYCGAAEGRLEIEHIVPVARGGSNRRQNLTIACRPCNLQKGTLTAAEFGHPDVHERAKGIH